MKIKLFETLNLCCCQMKEYKNKTIQKLGSAKILALNIACYTELKIM